MRTGILVKDRDLGLGVYAIGRRDKTGDGGTEYEVEEPKVAKRVSLGQKLM